MEGKKRIRENRRKKRKGVIGVDIASRLVELRNKLGLLLQSQSGSLKLIRKDLRLECPFQKRS